MLSIVLVYAGRGIYIRGLCVRVGRKARGGGGGTERGGEAGRKAREGGGWGMIDGNTARVVDAIGFCDAVSCRSCR